MDSALLPPILVALAWGLAWWLPDDWRPQSLVARLAQWLAHKTNHPERSPEQRRLAGALATALVVVPITLAVILASQIATFPQLFDLALLVWLFPGQRWRQERKRVDQALLLGNDTLARRHLTPWTSQDLQQQNQPALIATTIEAQLERQRDELFTPVFWFLCLGPAGAAISWLLLQLERQWPQQHQGPFAWSTRSLLALVELPVNVLLSLVLDPRLPWRPAKVLANDWQQQFRLWPLRAMAWRLQCQLAGPGHQFGQHLRRPRLGPPAPPQQQMVTHSQRLLDAIALAALALWLLAAAWLG